jgi:sialate O-acetylesterase
MLGWIHAEDGELAWSTRMMKRWLLLTGIICVSVPVRADVKLPAIFGNEMVIQRETKAPVWGWADPGEKVTVTGSWGAKAETVTHDNGKWAVKLDTPKAGGPLAVTIAGNNKIELKDVLSGEVWVCSGQSNMQLQVNECRDAEREIAKATYPKIRLFQIERVPSHSPLDDAEGTWETCSPESVKGFSGTAYFFGRKLHGELKIPVGLVLGAWGATTIEAWTPRDTQLDDPIVKRIMETVDKRAHLYDEAKAKERYEKAMEGWQERFAAYKASGYNGHWPSKPALQLHPQQNQHYPGNLYNGMINPIVPFAIRGVIWYQGESNSKRAENYEQSLKRMIAAWREVWGQGDFPFYFVQLPNFRAPWTMSIEHDTWPIVREAFLNTAKTVPNTGMAITIDIGDISNIHPKNKQGVGDRLARVALRKTYGQMDHAWSGPYYTDCRIEGGKATVTFENGNSPLAVRNGGTLFGFALADKTGKRAHAEAVIEGDHTVVVSSPKISEPVCVLYAWANNPAGANLMNEAGLPASPFCHGPMPEFREEDLFTQMLPEEAEKYQLLYAFDPTNPRVHDKTRFIYKKDNSGSLKGPVKKVAYFLALKGKTGGVQYAFASMDPFSQDLKELGVPVRSVGKIFQQEVTGVEVKSNVKALKTGMFDHGCNIEFWDCNYVAENSAQVPNADDKTWDFGDSPNPEKSPGYGSMQIHNHKEKQSIICFNRFVSGRACDVGIGNSKGESQDWTLTSSARECAGGELKVLILK